MGDRIEHHDYPNSPLIRLEYKKERKSHYYRVIDLGSYKPTTKKTIAGNLIPDNYKIAYSTNKERTNEIICSVVYSQSDDPVFTITWNFGHTVTSTHSATDAVKKYRDVIHL
jgi:hypothetical protein